MSKFMFNPGDSVSIKNSGRCFSSYEKMAIEMESKYWKSGFAPNNDMIGTVISCRNHMGYKDPRPIYLIRIKIIRYGKEVKEEYLMGEMGLELITREVFKDKDFEL